MSRKRVILTFLCAALGAGCTDQRGDNPEVVVFTSLDRMYSEPILNRFEAATGIHVRPVYDAEAAKTTGLVNRLMARRNDPECDVLWSSEPVQTQRLAELGLLEPYQSPLARRIPAQFRDPQWRWTGLAARMRVLIYNRVLVGATPPGAIEDLLSPRWRGRVAMATPFYGTTLSHLCLLRAQWSADRFHGFLRRLIENRIVLAPGNGAVRDLVAAGECAWGLTDTDDARGAVLDGQPVGIVIPDGRPALIPNTVALVSRCPHALQGKAMIDFLLSAEVERELAHCRSAQIPLGSDLKGMPTPWDELLAGAQPAALDVRAAAKVRQEVIASLRQLRYDR